VTHSSTVTSPGLSRGRAAAIVAALVVAEIATSFEASMIYAALASFYKAFRDPIAIGWLVTGFMLVASVSAGIFARLGDIYGRKRILVIALCLAFCGSVVSATATNLEWIIFGRALQGLTGATLPLCFGMVREYFPTRSVPLNIGIVAASATAGGAFGLVIGGLLVDHGSWQLLFAASAFVAAAAVVAIAFVVPRSRQFTPGRVDWIGGVLFAPGLCLLLYALGETGEHGWGAQQIGMLALGLAVLLGWVIFEVKVDNPMIDLRMLLNRQIGLTVVILGLLGLGAMNMGQLIMVMLQQPIATGVGLGVSATLAGVLHAPGSVVGVIAGPLCGWYAGRRGSRGVIILATACAVTAWAGVTIAHDSIWSVTVWMLLNSFAIGVALAAAPNLIVEAAPAARTSEATGLAQIARKITMASGAQILAIGLASSTVEVEGGVFPTEDAYVISYLGVTALCVLAFLVALCLPRRASMVHDVRSGSYVDGAGLMPKMS